MADRHIMYHDNTDLAALVSTRICHDLISPIGAIGNGFELLELSGVPASPEIDLIAASIRSANAKIRFFRIAFGHTPVESMIVPPEIDAALGDYFAGSRVEARYHETREAPRREVKLVLLAVLCLETALPFGGRIEIRRDRDGWRVHGESERLCADPDLWARLDAIGAAAPLGPALMQFDLLAALGAGRRPRPVADIGETSVEIRI